MKFLHWLMVCLSIFGSAASSDDASEFLDLARTFALTTLSPAPHDPSNRFSGVPEAIALGERLFFDTGLSRTGTISCATCHVTAGEFRPNESHPALADRRFRSVMPITGASHQRFLFWDGRADSLWAQALGPLETATEHGLTRTEVVQYVQTAYPETHALLGPPMVQPLVAASPKGNQTARTAWLDLTEDLRTDTNQRFADIGKLIAAYEETIVPGPSQWDGWIENAVSKANGQDAIPAEIRRGFTLFTGKARCVQCHFGALFTDLDFHITGSPSRTGQPLDTGRQAGTVALLSDPFNCVGPYSDIDPGNCDELRYLNLSMERSLGAFRTPSLRGVSQRLSLGHAGQIQTLREMVEHYNLAPSSPLSGLAGGNRVSEIVPLQLTSEEIDDLVAFLESI